MGDGEGQRFINSASTAFPENQIGVPANWANTMIGRVHAGRQILIASTGHNSGGVLYGGAAVFPASLKWHPVPDSDPR